MSNDVPGTWEHGDPGIPIEVPFTGPQRDMIDSIAASKGISFTGKRYAMGQATILVARESRDGQPRWHLSISRPDRHPSWDEIKAARYRLLPLDLTFGMLLPPPELYLNLPQQDHVFHLWEVPSL